ncbi:hypothetical protein J4E83_006477 [Alternaria metachromatica]|uniref:uncharacterized protein n=1 Tax=Alternaria metachromatica TaxID=283354 RepID=UPI0020C2A682|nr:uncharacterized protein J4E83_006477 [Alternaria metachromatica]KAI4616895.1 hypothetical protein J4E83_006477 [Alternaria metachromatica]
MTTPSTADGLNIAMSKITSANQLTSPLLSLPAELRNQIYTYVGLSTIIKAVQSEGAVVSSTVMSQITLTNALTSPLLRLPAELRNAIYTYVALSTIIRIEAILSLSATCSLLVKYKFHLPGLLSACKQTLHEATPIIYATCTFDTTQGDNDWRWLKSDCDNKVSRQITSLRIPEARSLVMAEEVWLRLLQRRDTKCCPLNLPSLEIVHVKSTPADVRRRPPRVREWFGNDTLKVRAEARRGVSGFEVD